MNQQNNKIEEQQIRNHYQNRDPVLVNLLLELRKLDPEHTICFMDELLNPTSIQ